MLIFSLRSSAALIALVVTATGCQSSLKMRHLPDTPEALECVSGLVVNHIEPHEVIAILPSKPGGDDLVERRFQLMLPSGREMYEVDLSGALLRTVQLDVDLATNGSIKRVKLDSKLEAAASLEALSESLSTAGEFIKAIRAAEQAEEEKKEADAKEEAGKEKAELEEQKAKLELELSIKKLNSEIGAFGTTKPPSQLEIMTTENSELEAQIFNLMLDANREALEKGAPLPFPDLVP